MSKDREILKELEKEIGRPLQQLESDDMVSPFGSGYAFLERGYVVEVDLRRIKNLKTIPITLLKFKHLKKLDLRFNELTDISVLQGLKNLTCLDLRNNKIKKLPEAIVDLGMEIDVDDDWPNVGEKGIYLYGNPLETPPPEIIRKGKEAIKAYFKSLEKGKLPLNEVKVLLVGDGGAGKTSLVKRLLGKRFNKKEPQTHGININQWEVKQQKTPIKTHIWDFGGQEIMHATHQFFLSKRSLYILVLDGRKDEKTEYWLKHIRSFGGDSPVLALRRRGPLSHVSSGVK